MLHRPSSHCIDLPPDQLLSTSHLQSFSALTAPWLTLHNLRLLSHNPNLLALMMSFMTLDAWTLLRNLRPYSIQTPLALHRLHPLAALSLPTMRTR